MVKPATDSLCTAASGKVHTEVSVLLEFVSLGEATVYVWLASVKRRSSFNLLVSVGKVFVVPDVIVVVTLYICCVFLRLLYLLSRWLLHKSRHLCISELLEEFVVLLELLILDTIWILLIHICLFIPLCQLLISFLFLINSCLSFTFIAKLFRSFLLLIVLRVHQLQVLHLKFFNLCLLFPVLFSLFLFSIFSLLFLFRKLGLILL